MSPLVTTILVALVKCLAIVLAFTLGLAAVLTWVERKYSAIVQDRVGPARAEIRGYRFGGIFHLIADSVKLFFKEDFVPAHANPILYRIAPFIACAPPLIVLAVIPFGPGEHFLISDVGLGMLFIFAIASLGVYGAVLGGWASNSKWSLLGGLRASAQMVSYEVCLGLNLVGVFMIYESVNIQDIVGEQGDTILGFLPAWGIFLQPVAFVLFLAASVAENRRAPFDLPEAESELVAGYFTEYSSMKFALFMFGEFIEIVAIAAIAACLFFGGWQIPWVHETGGFWLTLAQVGFFLCKVLLLVLLQLTIRWTLPRFRYDQLMRLCWAYILPLSLANICVTGVVLYFWQ